MKTSNKGGVMIIILLVVVVAGSLYFFLGGKDPIAGDYQKTAYMIDGVETTAKYLGDDLIADFDGNGRKDIAFLVSTDTSTTTLYYLVTALNTWKGYRELSAKYIGNQIMPMTNEYTDGKIIVNYADRDSGEPMTALPRFWKAKHFIVEGGELIKTI